MALLEWGDRCPADPEGPPVIVRHGTGGAFEDPCDEPVTVALECAAGHSHLAPQDIKRTPGPGARLTDAS